MSDDHPSNSGKPLSGLRRAERLAEDLAAMTLARFEKASVVGKDAISQLKSRGKGVAGDISNAAQALWLPENPAFVLAHSASFMVPPGGVPSEPVFLSITWRSDALLGLSALGVVTLEEEIITVTRSLFHDELTHQKLSSMLFGQNFDAIHAWMDTVPGSGVRGGGIVHRLQHGHDASAAIRLCEEHGITGGLVWIQHLLQDLATPTGIPIPVGGPTLSTWLIESGRATSGKAALLLSLNIAELAATVLAGAFAFRLGAMLIEFSKRKGVRRRCESALLAREKGDLDAVIQYYSEALSLSANDPSIRLALGWAYSETGRPRAESFLAFRSAAEGLATHDRLVENDGLRLSLRGVAYLPALTQAGHVFEEVNVQGAWRSELDRMLRGLIASFENAAIQQIEPIYRIKGQELILRPRPLSAAVNYYTAARAALSAAFLPASSEASRLMESARAQLVKASNLYPDFAPHIEAVEQRWSLEFSPNGIPVV